MPEPSAKSECDAQIPPLRIKLCGLYDGNSPSDQLKPEEEEGKPITGPRRYTSS